MGKLTIDYQKLHDAFFKYVHVLLVALGLWGVIPDSILSGMGLCMCFRLVSL